METLVWTCLVCGRDVLPELAMEDPTEAWLTQAVVLFPDNRIIKGEFNVTRHGGQRGCLQRRKRKPRRLP